MLGALQYLTMRQPDIVYGVHVVSQFMHVPRTTHLLAAKYILMYLQGTLLHGILLRAAIVPFIMIAYSDADWTGCHDSCCSTNKYAIFYGLNLIVWHSKKQPTSSKSSIKAEYRVVAFVITETIWICRILYDLGFTLPSPIRLYYDNVSATYLTANPVHHDHSKHIALDYHFAHECVTHGDLLVQHVPTNLKLANIFTKGLFTQQVLFHRSNLSVSPLYSLMVYNSIRVLM